MNDPTTHIPIGHGDTATPQAPFIWQPKWFLSTRFLAVPCVVLAIVISRFVFHITTFNYRALGILAAVLLISNIVYVLFYRSGYFSRDDDKEVFARRLVWFTKVQINVDLLLLTLMLHYSGGATNPFCFYYIFHMILSSILLSKRAAYIEAFVATAMFGMVTVLEGYEIIPHYYLFYPRQHSLGIFMTIIFIAETTTLFLSVYMATTIMDRLRLYHLDMVKALYEQRRLEAEKARFLDVVVHDLKSPIVAIESLVNSVLSVHGDTIEPNLKKVLERIPVRTQDLIRFIKKLLEFSRIKNTKQLQMQLKPLNFLPIVTTTVEIYMAQAMEKNITVSVQSDPVIPPIMGSQEHLESMVANLISNAIGYTRDDGSVTVKVGIENDDVTLTVADTGIGIPEDALPKLFTEFFRAPNAKKMNATGTGIGMFIVKKVVDEHGGSITVQSQEGEGTAFTVRLPAAPR